MKLAFYDARWAAAGTANGTLFDRAVEYDQWLRGNGAASRFSHVEFVFDETPVPLEGATVRSWRTCPEALYRALMIAPMDRPLKVRAA